MQSKLLVLRREANITQKQMASIINVSLATYCNKELGKVQFTIDEMFKIAEYFGLGISDIFLPRIHQNSVKGE